MINAVIIDDENKGRMALKQKIADYCPEVEIVGEASDGMQGRDTIERLKPNLVFLDIEMPKVNGFEMLNQLKDKKFYLIFTTAYDHYAIKAIKYAAFDYLLKPIDISELKSAIERINTTNLELVSDQIDLLQQNIKNPKAVLNKLAIPTLEGLCFYPISELVYLEASSNYTNLFFIGGKKVVASKTLKDFEELLPEDTFFRPHHSYIINLNFISKYIKGDGGQIELMNGAVVDVSRRKKEEFLKVISR
jgi:two-component system, LytTR family, response regulator